MEEEQKLARPLARSITIGCLVFIAILCLILGFSSHFNYKHSLYQRYEAYITDILRYVDRQIDDYDLANCIARQERSKKYDQLELFMDGIMEDFDIHYLYIIKPLNLNPTGNVMSVLSAEKYYDRHIDTEGNLYLGWISDDEFGVENVKKYFEIMESKNPVFFEEKTEWGIDYTGALTLFDSKGKPYSILAVDVDITEITKLIRTRTIITFGWIIILGALFTFSFLFWTRRNITSPIHRLEESVVAFAEKSHGQRNLKFLKFDAPSFYVKNEVYVLSNAVVKMTSDMRNYVDDVIAAERKASIMQEQANQMSELANKDSLTGIRNKTAYDKEIKNLEYDLGRGRLDKFGIGMIDLNFLKRINDTYGHEHGNLAIKKLCGIVCKVFEHSPVFRIGSDEFVVILRGHDYDNMGGLVEQFHKELNLIDGDAKLDPWEKVSAAIGIAIYDKSVDANVLNVFKRADKKMYECKKSQKAIRES